MAIVKTAKTEFGKYVAKTTKSGKIALRVGTDKTSRFVVKVGKTIGVSYGSVFRNVWEALLSEKANLPTDGKQIAFARKLVLDNNVESAKVVKGGDLSPSEMYSVVSTALISLFGIKPLENKTVSLLTDSSEFERLLAAENK